MKKKSFKRKQDKQSKNPKRLYQLVGKWMAEVYLNGFSNKKARIDR